MSSLFVLCFNSFYLKYDFLCFIFYLLLESCFHASAPFYHAFMHLHLSIMLSCCLSVFGWFFSFFKNWKIRKIQKQCVFFVHWYLCILDSHWNKFFCLDEHLYAQLSKWALWLLFVMSKINLSLIINTHITPFDGKD